MKNKSREEGPSLFTDCAYDINLEAHSDQKDLQFPEKYAFTQRVSELSRKAFFGLFNIIASESLKDNYSENVNDEFGNTINVLFQHFNLDHLDKHDSIETSLRDYIIELEQYNFFLPKIFLDSKNFLDKSNYNLSPDEFGFYDCDLDTLAKVFKDVLRLLREEKIAFWKKLFGQYKKDKEGYDLGFRTIATRQKKDLERASKITPEDIKSVFKQ